MIKRKFWELTYRGVHRLGVHLYADGKMVDWEKITLCDLLDDLHRRSQS